MKKKGAGCSDLEKFKELIYKKYDYALDKLQDITLKIANMYTNMGAIFNVQIDSFVYVDKKTGNIIYIFKQKKFFFHLMFCYY